MNYLSKSDYKVGHDCPTKLYYKKMKYPSQMDADEYLIFLAKGGYAVGKMATLYFPEGIEVTAGDPREAIEITEKYLKMENVTLFEAAILADHKLIRVDILRKKGKNIDLIEVKSKSFDSTKIDELSGSDFKDYLYDIGFQYLTVKERFPDCNITPYLYMPDKSKFTKMDGLSFMFTIKDVPTNTRFRKYEVEVEKSLIAQITKENILSMVNVKGIIDNYISTIKKELELLLPSIKSDLIRIDTPLSKKCFKCEYSCEEKNGYDECWQNMPKPKYHIKDISRFGNTKAIKAIDDLIAQKRISYDELYKLLGDSISDQRRKIQIEYTIANKV